MTSERVRKVDVNEKTVEQVEKIQESINKKLIFIVDEAVEKANKMLNIYGLETKMSIVIQEKSKN